MVIFLTNCLENYARFRSVHPRISYTTIRLIYSTLKRFLIVLQINVSTHRMKYKKYTIANSYHDAYVLDSLNYSAADVCII